MKNVYYKFIFLYIAISASLLQAKVSTAGKKTPFAPGFKRLSEKIKTSGPAKKQTTLRDHQATSENEPVRLAITTNDQGVRLISGITTGKSLKEKLYADCNGLVWAKQQELIIQLESVRQISDQSALRLIHQVLAAKYDTNQDKITRFGYELYCERALLEADAELLALQQHLLTKQEYDLLTTCLAHYLTVIMKLDEIVNSIIMGHHTPSRATSNAQSENTDDQNNKLTPGCA